MSKIILAINSMIENLDEISAVVAKGNEYFFSYQGSIWSIFEYYLPIESFPTRVSDLIKTYTRTRNNGYYLVLYPRAKSVSELESLDNPRSKEPNIIYNSEDLKTQEAYESFHELYNIIKGKLYGADDVLNKIIGSSKKKN